MEQCYLCGAFLVKGKNRSRDHIPPSCIFPKEKPRNLITVPCCVCCNQELKQLDQKMRNCIAAVAGNDSGEVGLTAKNDILLSFRHSMEFLSSTRPHPSLKDDKGSPRYLFFFEEDELSRWMVRIVKGLILHKTGRIVDKSMSFQVKPVPQVVPQPSATFPMEEGLEFRPQFVYGEVKDGDNDLWVLIYYDHLVFVVSLRSQRQQA